MSGNLVDVHHRGGVAVSVGVRLGGVSNGDELPRPLVRVSVGRNESVDHGGVPIAAVTGAVAALDEDVTDIGTMTIRVCRCAAADAATAHRALVGGHRPVVELVGG